MEEKASSGIFLSLIHIFTIPKHEPIKKVYVEMVRQIVESEAKNDEDAE